MRVRFTEDEGVSELEYPVFGPDATTAFDTLVVDARLNNVWHYGGGVEPTFQRNRAQYLRDQFAADLQTRSVATGPTIASCTSTSTASTGACTGCMNVPMTISQPTIWAASITTMM